MSEPRVPGDRGRGATLPCGEQVTPGDLDMGMREFQCDCGAAHAVVMDVHPPERFLPAFLVEVLQTVVETADEWDAFGTPHLMGMVLEEIPGEMGVVDAAEDGNVGWTMAWVAQEDSRRLHEIVVELVVELMDHALSHADDTDAVAEFEAAMLEFDVPEFVDQYRRERETTAGDVPGYDRG